MRNGVLWEDSEEEDGSLSEIGELDVEGGDEVVSVGGTDIDEEQSAAEEVTEGAQDEVLADEDARAKEEVEGEYEVEEIMDRRVGVNGAVDYLVKWKHYPDTENLWLRKDQLEGASALVREYEGRERARRSFRRGAGG